MDQESLVSYTLHVAAEYHNKYNNLLLSGIEEWATEQRVVYVILQGYNSLQDEKEVATYLWESGIIE